MANYVFYPQRLTGHLLSTPDLIGVMVDIGGALLRRSLEDPDNLEGTGGIAGLPAGHRITSILKRGLQPATKVAGGAGPYALVDGDTLLISVAGGANQTVTLSAGSFAVIGAATRDEVVTAILAAGLTGAAARAVRDIFVLHSTDEHNDSIQVTGGTAVAALGLDTDPHNPFPADDVSGYDWSILSTAEDDQVFPALVFDPGFLVTDPCPALTAWAAVLG